MKKNIATWLRKIAQRLDPQKGTIPGIARKVVGYIPYFGIDNYRDLLMAGEEDKARTVKMRMRHIAEISALANLEENLSSKGILRLEHNFGTTVKEIDGVRCPAEGVTVIVELQGTWS
ncbi:MAG: hypothetical protein IJ307_05725 [Bacteroidales bacterium]|nr:hypothetical protein [Bacteroidales bacterium]